MKTKSTIFLLSALALVVVVFSSCKKDKPDTGPRLIFKFKFDSTQVRLNNIGQPATLPSNHRAQSPKFNTMSAHYVELAGDWDALGSGKVLYKAEEVTNNNLQAIDFSKATIVREGEEFYSVPLSLITPGSYKWLRVSLAYQNYDIKYLYSGIYGTGTVASFIGYRTYVNSYKIKNQTITPSQSAGGPGNHAQGYWGFETTVFGTPFTVDGQAPAGATTVPNPNFANSPIPAGSCVVTGKFVTVNGIEEALTVTGEETQDVVITVSLSTNNSFEWIENGGNNVYEPATDAVVDMGVRGLIPYKP